MNRHKELRNMVFCAILIALMFAFSWTPLGFIPLGVVSPTTVFLPVAIGILCLDKKRYGIILGVAFGVCSWIRSFAPSTVLDPYFQNPLVSVLPRALMGICATFIYAGIKKIIKNDIAKSSIIGLIVPFLNTLFTMSMLLLVDYKDITELVAQYNYTVASWLFSSVALLNMLPEMVLGLVVCIVVIKVYDAIANKKVEDEKTNE